MMKKTSLFLAFFFANVVIVAGYFAYSDIQSKPQSDSFLTAQSDYQSDTFVDANNAYLQLADRSRIPAISLSEFIAIRRNNVLWYIPDSKIRAQQQIDAPLSVAIDRQRIDSLMLNDVVAIQYDVDTSAVPIVIHAMKDDGQGNMTWIGGSEGVELTLTQDEYTTRATISIGNLHYELTAGIDVGLISNVIEVAQPPSVVNLALSDELE